MDAKKHIKEQNNKVTSFSAKCSNLHFINEKYIEDLIRQIAIVKPEGVDFIFIDYIQKLKSKNSKDNRHIEIEAISSKLKKFAIEHNFIVIALLQFNRNS
ncbi:MAG TPA: DnaB-like helicase C-terminal domain-containing protein [Candidatus Azoamicus sp.]